MTTQDTTPPWEGEKAPKTAEELAEAKKQAELDAEAKLEEAKKQAEIDAAAKLEQTKADEEAAAAETKAAEKAAKADAKVTAKAEKDKTKVNSDPSPDKPENPTVAPETEPDQRGAVAKQAPLALINLVSGGMNMQEAKRKLGIK